jgi:hypothetical protein
MSTLKLIDELKGKQGLHLGRMVEDHMPYRGPYFPMREEEYEELTEVTQDAGANYFEITSEESRLKYQEILDRAANGWYNIYYKSEPHFIDMPDGSFKIIIYCEWGVPHRQLNTQRAESFGPLTG